MMKMAQNPTTRVGKKSSSLSIRMKKEKRQMQEEIGELDRLM
jgi:hypothetical protein